MATIQQSIEVNVPVHTAYHQLTQFEEYPRFMEGVEEVRQLDDRHLHWHTRTSNQDLQWDAEITEQVPDRCIAWRNTSGPKNIGRVELEAVDNGATRLTLRMEIDPQERASGETSSQQRDNPLDAVAQRAEQDLARFKKFIESRDSERGESGAEVQQAQASRAGGARQQDASTQSPASLSGAAAGGQQQSPVAEEQSFDQQSVQARRVGKMPDAGGGPQGVPGQPSPAEAIAQALSAQAPQPQATPQQEAQPLPRAQEQQQMTPQSWLPNFLHVWEDPFVVMQRMTQEMDQLFEKFVGRPLPGFRGRGSGAVPGGSWLPPLDILQRGDQLVVSAELPGVKREDVHVEIRNDRLIIEGDRHEQAQGQQQEYRRTERSYGHFYRMISLPESVDADAATASMRDGVLEITLPVLRNGHGRRVEIRTPE